MKYMKDIFRSYAVFDAQGRHINGTDKESNHHYGAAYEMLFTKRGPSQIGLYSVRDRVNLMMEVGIADGSSLLAWHEIFPNAMCVGLDIHPSAKACGDRTEFHLGNQIVREDCERAADGRQFDFIVEDATHQLADSLLTLLYLWPFVKPGGIYVIEEFANVGALRANIASLWPNAEIVDTIGPSGGVEPLVVFRKPL